MSDDIDPFEEIREAAQEIRGIGEATAEELLEALDAIDDVEITTTAEALDVDVEVDEDELVELLDEAIDHFEAGDVDDTTIERGIEIVADARQLLEPADE